MTEQYRLELRFEDGNTRPELIRSRDVAKLIAAFEQMLAVLVAVQNPALDIEEERVSVGLVGVREGSYILEFATPFPVETAVAAQRIAEAVNTGVFSGLPVKAIESLRDVRSFARDYNGVAQLWERNGSERKLTSVSTTTLIGAPANPLRERTVLYGKVIRVGGESNPTARLRLHSGHIMTCDIANQSLAMRVAERLYTKVGVAGRADYDPVSLNLIAFRIEQLTEYRQVPLAQALDELENVLGPYLQAIDDLDTFIAEVRGRDEES